MNHGSGVKLFLLLVMCLLIPAFLFGQQLEIHFINVSWGGSLFIKGPNGTTVLIEAGGSGKGSGRVVPYLQSIGVMPANGLDYTIVGHQHSDHLGGMDEVINAGYDVRVKNYYNGSSYSTTQVTQWNTAASSTTAGALVAMPVGTEILLGNGAKITCVARNGSIVAGGSVSVSDENDRSIALLVQYGGFDFLWASDMGGGNIDEACTGRFTSSQTDVETSVITAISPGGASPKISSGGIDVLYSNHHGSESSTNKNWMNMSRPAVAVVSVGSGQSSGWDLPRKDVVENVLLAQATSCITVPPALVLQTEEGAPAGSLTSTAGYCVGNIRVTTDGVNNFIVSADGQVSQGPNELAASGLPLTLALDDAGGPPDTTPPVISDVQATSITSSSTTISWTTDENANSVVEYGLTTGYGSIQSDPTLVTTHTISLSGLSASTTYHYRVISIDASNNSAASADNTFTTSASGGSTHVVLSEIFYDTPGTDSNEEWIELHNQTTSDVDLGGWTIVDNNGTGSSFSVPSGTLIRAGTYLTIAVNQAGFQALYGRNADIYGALPALNNDGDALLLKNSGGQVADAAAWEGGATSGLPAGWGSTTLPNASIGNTIVRIDANADGDTYADWTTAPNNGNPQTQFVVTQYAPTSMTISVGTAGSGNYTNLATDNSSSANVNSTTSGPRTSDWYATVTISEQRSSVTKVIATYNGKQSKSGITQKVSLFNYTTNAWNQIDSRTVGTTEVTITNIPANPQDFISTTGIMRLRVLSTSTSKSFTTNADYVHWAVESNAAPSAAANRDVVELVAEPAQPEGFALEQNYPNPFNPTTVIRYYLPVASQVRLSVFDVLGQEVSLLVDGHFAVGYHTAVFSGKDLPSGVYFYKLNAGTYTTIKKLMLVK